MNLTKRFFEEVVGMDGEQYIEMRIHDNFGKYNPISKYIKTFEEYKEILKNFNSDRWNIYFGINKRHEKVRTMRKIPIRYLHYFDIESNGIKPEYNTITYKRRLEKAINVIINYLKNKYNLDYASILMTGRGVSLYYKFKPIPIEMEDRFKQWIKNNIYEELKDKFRKNEYLYNKKEGEFKIKCWDSVFDSSRINGAPLSIHTKYPEKPMRKVLKINDFKKDNDIENILNSVVIHKKKNNSRKNIFLKKNRQNITPKSRKKNNLNFYDIEEFKILNQYQNIPEGSIKRCIIFPLKTYTRDFDHKNYDKLVSELNRLGYGSEEHNIPDDNYDYSQSIFRNWCFRNFRWCLKNNFRVKYKLNMNKKIRVRSKDLRNTPQLNIFLGTNIYPLKTMDNVIKFIIKFNKKTNFIDTKQNIVLDWKTLEDELQKRCNRELLNFIRKNNIINELKYLGLDNIYK